MSDKYRNRIQSADVHIVFQVSSLRLPSKMKLYDQWHQRLFNDLPIQTMFSMKVNHVFIVFAKDILAIDCGVVVCKKAIDILTIFIGNAVKLVRLHLSEMLDDFGCDSESSFSILPRIEELKGAFIQNIFMLGQVERRVDTDAIEAPHLLSIHSTHTGANNHIGLLPFT